MGYYLVVFSRDIFRVFCRHIDRPQSGSQARGTGDRFGRIAALCQNRHKIDRFYDPPFGNSFGDYRFLVFYQSKNALEKQIFDDLQALASSKQGQIFAYLDGVESRTKDFSSDGFIRDSLRDIINTRSSDAAALLDRHLIYNKKSLDENIIGIFIIDGNGAIVSSTDSAEIGDNEADDEYFQQGLRRMYIAEVPLEGKHFQTANERRLLAATNLTDKTTGDTLGFW